MYLVNPNETCQINSQTQDDEIVFSKIYPGTESRRLCKADTTKGGCLNYVIHPTTMEVFYGKKICGKRGGPG